MRRRLRFIRAALAVYAIALTVVLVRIDPALLGGRPAAAPPSPMAVFGGAPFRGRIGRSLTEPTFTYRGSGERRGVAPAGESPPPHALAWQLAPVNAGIHGAAKSSPAVDASGIYVGADTGMFYALDLSGALRWSFHVDNAPQGIHATAALDGDNVYFGDYKGRFYALRKDDGGLVWANQLGETIGSSAAIVGPAIYVTVERNRPFDGFVARLDRLTGAVVWMSDWLGDQSHASPTIDEARGALYVGANNGVLRALALDTGRERWRAPLAGSIKTTAALVGPTLYVSTGAGSLYAVAADSGRVLWVTALSGTAKGSPSYVPGEDLLIVGSSAGSDRRAARGRVQAVAARDGRVVWTVDTDLGDMRASPTVVPAAAPGGDSLAWTSCGERALCALVTATGASRERLAVPAAFTGTPTLFAGRLYVTLFDGGLLAFRSAAPPNPHPGEGRRDQ